MVGWQKPNSFSVSIFHSVQDYSKIAKRMQDYYSGSNYGSYYGNVYNSSLYQGFFRNTGGSITYGKRLNWPDRNFSLSSVLSYQYYDVSNSILLSNFQNGQAHDITLGLNLSRYTLNNPQFTTSGSNISLNASFNPPYSAFGKQTGEKLWIEGHKWMFDADWYAPLVGKFVLHAKR